MKVLVVEDEKRISGFIRKGLEEHGFTVEVSANGHEAYQLATSQQYDAIVLDIMLPGRDGLSILQNLRKQSNPVPVLLLTARTELGERVEGLNLGADDYMTKPFYIEELVARLHALGRRTSGERLSILQSGPLTVNLLTREVTIEARPIRLTTREFNLLEYLMRSPGRVLTRTQILEHLWGFDFDTETNLIDVHVQRLRKKLGGAAASLETVRGVGYRFIKASS